MSKTTQQTAIAILTFKVASSARVQLFPDGAFSAEDGRPYDSKNWQMSQAVADRLIKLATEKTNDYVIDYEHQTLNTEWNGSSAPASGWFSTLEYQAGIGLFASNVSWTDKAKAHIDADEYRYISPVFRYDSKTGEILEILHVALTNNPALDGMDKVAAKFNINNQKDDVMSLKKVVAALSVQVADDATPEQTETAVIDAITALKAQSASSEPDPTKFVPIASLKTLQDELTVLKKTNADAQTEALKAEVDGVVLAALKDAKLASSQKESATNYGLSDITALKKFIADAPVIDALKNQQLPSGSDASSESALTEEQSAVCKATGVDPQEFRKFNS